MIVTSVQIKTVKMQKHLYCPVFTEKRYLYGTVFLFFIGFFGCFSGLKNVP